jgi:hypothetical protein
MNRSLNQCFFLFSSSESLMTLSLIIQNIGLRLISIDNQVQLFEFDCLLMLFIRRLKNET